MIRTFGIAALVGAVTAAEAVFTPPVAAFPQQPSTPGPTVVIFIDDLHLDFTSTGYIKELYRTIVRQLPEARDLIGAVSTGPSSLAIDVTSDRKHLESAVEKISGSGLKPAEILSNESTPQYSEVRYRSHVAFNTAYGILKMLGRMPGPHKALIDVSNGYNVDLWVGAPSPVGVNPFEAGGNNVTEQRLRDEVAALTEQARRANVTIYAINAAALFGRPTIDPNVPEAAWKRYRTTTDQSLQVIAEPSGGFVIRDNLESGLKRISDGLHH